MQLSDPLGFNDAKLFHSLLNDNGYVLDLNSAQFDALTQQTVGFRATERYDLSKGRSLFKLLSEEPAAQTLKLVNILLDQWHRNHTSAASDDKRELGERCIARLQELQHQTLPSELSTLTRLASEGFTGQHLDAQRKTLQANLSNNPAAVIGQAKELLESCYKTILLQRGIYLTGKENMPRLMYLTREALGIDPKTLNGSLSGDRSIREIVNAVQKIVDELNTLRNQHGSGHGKEISEELVPEYYGQLAINAALLAVEFLWGRHINTRNQTDSKPGL